MNDIRESQLVTAETNNRAAVWLSFNGGTVSQTVRSGTGPYIKRNRPSVFRPSSGIPAHLHLGDASCPPSPSHGFFRPLNRDTQLYNLYSCDHEF
jgi:hypothetical protein